MAAAEVTSNFSRKMQGSNIIKVTSLSADETEVITEDNQTISIVTVTLANDGDTEVTGADGTGEPTEVHAENELIVTTTPSTADERNVITFITESDYGFTRTDSAPASAVNHDQVCVVCGDRGSGYHYSLYSCEGCKGFFKRSVQKNLTYTCKNDGDCDINRFTRNTCQYCRFKKCLAFGMKREGVREDRTPGGKHKSIIKRARYEDGVQQVTTAAAAINSIPSGAEDDELLYKLLVATSPHEVPKYDDEKPLSLEHLMEMAAEEMELIFKWAKKIPLLEQLDAGDQVALLRSSLIELLNLRIAYRSLNCEEGAVMLTDMVVLTQDEMEQIGFPKELSTSVCDAVRRLREVMRADDEKELCLLSAILLLYSDATGLVNRESVANRQQKYLELLRQHHTNSATSTDDPHRFGKLLLRLPALRVLSISTADAFLKLMPDVKLSIPISAASPL